MQNEKVETAVQDILASIAGSRKFIHRESVESTLRIILNFIADEHAAGDAGPLRLTDLK